MSFEEDLSLIIVSPLLCYYLVIRDFIAATKMIKAAVKRIQAIVSQASVSLYCDSSGNSLVRKEPVNPWFPLLLDVTDSKMLYVSESKCYASNQAYRYMQAEKREMPGSRLVAYVSLSLIFLSLLINVFALSKTSCVREETWLYTSCSVYVPAYWALLVDNTRMETS